MKKSVLVKLSGILPSRHRWAYALSMPAFLILFNYLMVGAHSFRDWQVFTGAALLNTAILIATFYVQSAVNRSIAKRYAGLDQTLKRIVAGFAAHALWSAAALIPIAWFYMGTRIFGSTATVHSVIILYVVNLGIVVLLSGIVETFHAIRRWKQQEVNKERLLKENVNGQLESLKAQISPHFLFNTLNSLSALIGEDPEKAEEFVDEMARVYRYLLQTNHSSVDEGDFSQLTTLRKELSFIASYGHLLKTRYGEGMKLYIHVENSYLDHRIPPLTLQLLVENAVKHNVIRASKPLTIFILSTVEGELMVRNNLQKKSFTAGVEQMESTQVGLANILSKYKLLGEYRPELSQPVIESNHEFFTVTLPLIS